MSQTQHILTILAVSELTKAKSFYCEAFGWKIDVDEPVYVQFVLPSGMMIGLYTREGFASNTGSPPARCSCVEGSTTGTELYLQCEDVAAVVESLRAVGARELAPLQAKPWGDDVAYFADPDGNVLAVAQQHIGD